MNRTLIPFSCAALLFFLALTLRMSAAQHTEGFTQEELEAVTEEIRGEIEDLRGLQFERPVSVSVTDREGFVAYAKERIERMSSIEEIDAQETVAKLLGLLPVELDLLEETFRVLEEQVGGFYDPSNDTFYLMDTFGGDLARIILAHELTHALDDQHFDIDGTMEGIKGNSDALFGFHAVVEGSGTAVMTMWMMERMTELDPGAMTESGISTDVIEDAPPYLWKPLLGTYLCGASFLNRTDSLAGGQMSQPDPDDLDRAFQRPPASSEQILHPEKYWSDEDPPQKLLIGTDALSAGWSLLHEDTLGELGLAMVLEPLAERGGFDADPAALLNMRFTNDAAEGWEGDRYVLLGRDEARVLVLLGAWESEADTAQVDDALASLGKHLRDAGTDYARSVGLAQSCFVERPGPFPNSRLILAAAGLGPDSLDELVGCLSFGLKD